MENITKVVNLHLQPHHRYTEYNI